MRVIPATPAHLPAIHLAYAAGRVRQLELSPVAWPGFTDEQILAEIAHELLFCVMDGSKVAAVFSIAYNDALIWGDRERNGHIYLHRISRGALAAARGVVPVVLSWAHVRCAELRREGLRIDTWANNEGLVSYYKRLGFQLVATRTMPADSRLSAHYHGIELALMEERCGNSGAQLNAHV